VDPYSPDRRTALLFCGTGAHGAYQAGVLRALQEAGVKIDLVAGQGIGALTAAMAALDGGARLWEADGLWRGGAAAGLYRWKRPLVAATCLLLILIVIAIASGALAFAGRSMAPYDAVAAFVAALGVIGVLGGSAAVEQLRASARRSGAGAWWWRAAGTPLDAGGARDFAVNGIWGLIRGAAPIARPDLVALCRRYSEVLAESLGQPGFRELLLVAHDLETRGDLVAALLREAYRHEFMARRPGRERRAEALDLAGLGRDHAVDIVCGAVSLSLGTDPHLTTFGPDTYWRGETHRVADRPGGVARVLEELYAAGVSQVILVTAVAVAATPHRLVAAALDLRRRIGDAAASAEAAAVRDAIEQARLRFDGIFPICPAHNPVGPLDFSGAYDQTSDRWQSLEELMERGYEDAYRQFIEPIVGASGDHLHIGDAHGQRVLDDADSRR
jgi:hypothetical protein